MECPVCQKGKIVSEKITEVREIRDVEHESQNSPRVLENYECKEREVVDILDEKVFCDNCRVEFECDSDGRNGYWVSANLEKVVLK